MSFWEAFMKKTNYVKDILVVLLGNFMVAVSVAFFVLPNNTLTGGVARCCRGIKTIITICTIRMADQHIDDWTLRCWCNFFGEGICTEVIDFNI